jgi:hypothetical protein
MRELPQGANLAVNDKVIVKGFSKIGKIVNDDPADLYFTVEFERIKILVDKKTQTILLPANCFTVQD